jgi:hypothetical protein
VVQPHFNTVRRVGGLGSAEGKQSGSCGIGWKTLLSWPLGTSTPAAEDKKTIIF